MAAKPITTPRRDPPAPRYDPNLVPRPWRDCVGCGWRHYRDLTSTYYLPYPVACASCGDSLAFEPERAATVARTRPAGQRPR